MLAALSPCRATAEPYVLGYAGAAITQDKNLRTEVEVNGAPFVNGLAHDLSFDTTPVFGAKGGFTFRETGTIGGVPVTETARDRADLTSHLLYGGLGFHW